MNREEKRQEIIDRFECMMANYDCISDFSNPIKSMTVTGASGIGKSYNLINRLKEEDDMGLVNFHYLNGKVTTLGLYQALWGARHVGSVLLLDDVDVFDSEDKLNILKAALESDDERIISYKTSSKALAEQGIEQQFNFEGKIIFITNKDLLKLSKGHSDLAPHMAALITRGVFVDLGIHDNESIMIHIETIMRSTNIVKRYVSDSKANEILDYMVANARRLRNPSLRLPVQLAGLVKAHGDKWVNIANKTVLEAV